MSFIDYVGSAGFIFGCILILSPFPALYQGIKDMEIKNLSQLYMITGLLNAFLWMTYGLRINDFFVGIANIFGSLMFLIYLNMFLYITSNKLNMLIYTIGALIIVGLMYTVIPVEVLGSVALLISSSWTLSPILTMRKALAVKDVAYVNILLAWVSVTNFGLWFLYGCLAKNIYYMIPNAIGTIIFGLNIVIYFWGVGRLSHDNIVIRILKCVFCVTEEGDKEKNNTNTNTDTATLIN